MNQVESDPRQCPGGDNCTCCGTGCDCGCRNDCPKFRWYVKHYPYSRNEIKTKENCNGEKENETK